MGRKKIVLLKNEKNRANVDHDRVYVKGKLSKKSFSALHKNNFALFCPLKGVNEREQRKMN